MTKKPNSLSIIEYEDKSQLLHLQQALEYKYNNEDLLIQALTSKSKGNNYKCASWETLATLGDAIHKTVCIAMALEKGKDTKWAITSFIEHYVSEIRQAQSLREFLKGNALKIETLVQMDNGERKQKTYTGSQFQENLFEALIGSVFLDSGKNYEVVEKLVLKLQDF